ncbi:MAG: tyrosine--tRNA ligase [Candidatus Omnitrophica bacterium]|nr:tyrosine--tRNA ligase [Candidatus Omnitrophota bacterium]
MTTSVAEQLALIKRGAADILSEPELVRKLESGRPLVVKAGFDPTAPDLHLGHTVLLRKLRHFQSLGHRVVFLIGDFTGMIGDPSGRHELRPALTPQDILANAKTYAAQIRHVLDLPTLQIRRNSEWLGQMRLADFLAVGTKLTVPRLLERDDFTQRLKTGESLTVTEVLYPLLQAYDSVALKADVELGGADQRFNLLMGRALQERCGQPPQVVITVPLLEGLDGVQKMSKSLGNAVGIHEAPEMMYGQLMSVSDELMWKYYELLTDDDLTEVKGLHPMAAKKRLAATIVTQYHGAPAAEAAAAHFTSVIQQKQHPDQMPDYRAPSAGPTDVVSLLVAAGLCPSRGEAKRMVQQGAVEVGGRRVTDPAATITLETGMVIQVGRMKFRRVRLGG